MFSYKGRIDLDHCDIIPVQDGKGTFYIIQKLDFACECKVNEQLCHKKIILVFGKG